MTCKTVYRKSLESDVSNFLYKYIMDSVEWSEGIRSKKGFTRKAYIVSVNTPLFIELMPYVEACISNLTNVKYNILGIYLNYYEDGEMYAPNHSHKGTHQLIISLGETRILTVGKKSFNMKNGDAIIFGSAIHGIPKSDTKKGRISIATFMIPTVN